MPIDSAKADPSAVDRDQPPSRRTSARAQLDAAIRAKFDQLPSAEISRRMLDAQIAFGAVNSVADLSTHPQLRRMTVASSTGDVELVAPPVTIDDENARTGRVPALGAHTEEIRRRFGSTA